MFYKKEGFPEEGEILLCTVKKVLYNSIFVKVEGYKNKEGMIHISEIAPGRIRNIRDYVKEGKTIVCKVLRINPERNQIDLSLRRVNLFLKKEKLIWVKQEEKAEKILELVGKKLKKSLEEMYELCGNKIIENYNSLYTCFQEVVSKGDVVLSDVGIPEDLVKSLSDAIKQKIKPQEVEINATLVLRSSASDGIDVIKKVLLDAIKMFTDKGYSLKIRYTSAPKYSLVINAQDYKTAEKELKEVGESIVSNIQKCGGEGEFEKND